MNKPSQIYLLIIITLLFLRCISGDENNEQGLTKTQIEQKNDQVEAEVLKRGELLSNEMQLILSGSLKKAITDSGVTHALQFCSLNANEITDKFSEEKNAKVSRVSHRNRNKANAANEAELNLIQSYLVDTENGIKTTSKVVEETDDYIFYKPIFINNPLCLKCHGDPGNDIANEDFILINMIYPYDRASKFTLGDLRGLWKIRMAKNQFNNS